MAPPNKGIRTANKVVLQRAFLSYSGHSLGLKATRDSPSKFAAVNTTDGADRPGWPGLFLFPLRHRNKPFESSLSAHLRRRLFVPKYERTVLPSLAAERPSACMRVLGGLTRASREIGGNSHPVPSNKRHRRACPAQLTLSAMFAVEHRSSLAGRAHLCRLTAPLYRCLRPNGAGCYS